MGNTVKFLAVMVMGIAICSCKIQQAPGAYAPAQGKINTKAFEKTEADNVDVTPTPEKITRNIARGENSGLTKSEAIDYAENEPSLTVVPDQVITVEVKDEEIVVDTVIKAEKDGDLQLAPEVPDKPVIAVKEVTRTEKVDVVAGQKTTELKKYNVVIGSFGKKENADNLQNQMRPEYEPVIVVNERGMYRVILKSFDTYGEAKAKIADLTDEFPDAWCLVPSK